MSIKKKKAKKKVSKKVRKTEPEVTPCKKNVALKKLVDEYAETLKREAHTLGNHGLSKKVFYDSGIFRGAIERIRGQYSASMSRKRAFVRVVLDYLKELKAIKEWKSAGEDNRHDYQVILNNDHICAIELKGCLDGNNTNIFTRPPNANEFILWGVCENPSSDPRRNAWSGIHTRLSAEIIDKEQKVDGLVIWDMVCGTLARPCPKIEADASRITTLDAYSLPPPCIYLFPNTIPSPRLNQSPRPHKITDVGFLKVLQDIFGVRDDELTYVHIEAAHKGNDTVRTTRLVRGDKVIAKSEPTPIRRG